MRIPLAVVAALALVVLLLARQAHSEPPPPMEARDLGKVILPALKKLPARRAQLATVRWYVEVFGGTSLQAPVGSPPDTLGPWGDDGALAASEAELSGRACGPMSAAELKAATALLTEYGSTLAPMLQGYALTQTGKKAEAAQLFQSFVEAQLPPGSCPSEHPMYSNRRISRMSLGIRCLEAATPGQDVSKLKKLLKKAEDCAANNHAVG